MSRIIKYLNLFFLLSHIVIIIFFENKIANEIVTMNIIFAGIYYWIINSNLKLLERQLVLNKNIEKLKSHNKDLKQANDEVRAFKHDFNNIMQAFGGYIKFNDFHGLTEYYQDLVKERNLVKSLTSSKLTLQEDSVYNVILKKIELAKQKEIEVEFASLIDWNNLEKEESEICNYLECMLDKAISITDKAKNKEIVISCLYDNLEKKNIIIIANTYNIEEKEILEKELKNIESEKGKSKLYISLDEEITVQNLIILGTEES